MPGTGVFLVSNADFVPTAMLRNLEHNHVVHERVISAHGDRAPAAPRRRQPRCASRPLMPGVQAVRARFGFMETPDVGEALRGLRARPAGPSDETSYFLGWHLVRALPRSGWPGFKMRVFA